MIRRDPSAFGLVAFLALSPVAAAAAPAVSAEVKVQLSGVDERVDVTAQADGSVRFVLHGDDGATLPLTPEAFARRVVEEQSRLAWWNRLLNVTSAAGIAWVALGLAGQLLFTGRMLVQWLASERQKRSVVPPVFWWMSLAGASMLLVYFVWRKDVVGVLGQAVGWALYGRNLWLIYAPGGPPIDPSSTPGHLPA